MSSSRPQCLPPHKRQSLANVAELFTHEQADPMPGSMNDEHVIRAVITKTIRECSKGRAVIAEEMSRLLGTLVTKRALDSYTCESADQNRWPAQYTRAFCHVTGDWTLLRCVSERAGLHVISQAERNLLELGRQYIIQKRAVAAIAELEHKLAEVTL